MLRNLTFALACTIFAISAAPLAAEEPKPAGEAAPKPKAGSPYGESKEADKAPAPVLSQEELEKQFAETMSGATLVGNFTMGSLKAAEGADKPKTQPPLKEDRYTLGKVTKL